MTYKKIVKISIIFSLFMIIYGLLPQTIYAMNLLEGMESSTTEHPMEHYMIDFHAPDANNWLPWNWGRAITGGAIWLLYAMTAVFWYLQVLLSTLGGWLVEEAFTTSLIGDLAVDLGKIVSELWNKFSNEYLPWVVIVVGVYIAYTALIKKEGSKAMQAFVNFSLTLVIAIGVFGRADHYIRLANDLSSGISKSALDAGTSILNLQTETEDGVGVIRGMLHELQIKQPWLMMQYGHTSVSKETYEQLLKYPHGSEERNVVVQSEVEENENMMLSPSGVLWRLPLFIFLTVLNLGIFVFCVILASIMIFAQLLFLLNVMFLPIIVIISLIPRFQNVRNKAILELFNSLMLRVSATLLVTVTFSISSLIYSMTQSRGLIITLIIQLICFLGVLLTLNKQLNRFNFDPNGASNQRTMNPMKRIMRKHFISRHIGRNIANRLPSTNAESENMNMNSPKTSTLNQVGKKLGKVVNAPRNIGTAVLNKGTQIKGLPISVSYGINKGIDDFKGGIKTGSQNEKKKRVEGRKATTDIIAKRKAKLSAKRTHVTKHPNVEMLKRGTVNRQPLMAHAFYRIPNQTLSPNQENKEVQDNRKPSTKLAKKFSINRQPLMKKTFYQTPNQTLSTNQTNIGAQNNRKPNTRLAKRFSENRQLLMKKASYQRSTQDLSTNQENKGVQNHRRPDSRSIRRMSVNRQPLMKKASDQLSNQSLPKNQEKKGVQSHRRLDARSVRRMAVNRQPDQLSNQSLPKNQEKKGVQSHGRLGARSVRRMSVNRQPLINKTSYQPSNQSLPKNQVNRGNHKQNGNQINQNPNAVLPKSRTVVNNNLLQKKNSETFKPSETHQKSKLNEKKTKMPITSSLSIESPFSKRKPRQISQSSKRNKVSSRRQKPKPYHGSRRLN